MKLSRFCFTLSILVVMMFEACDSGPKTCTIRGTVHGVEFDSLVISRLGEDFRFKGVEIPIIDSSFEYSFEFTHSEALKIFYLEQIRRGGGVALLVFSEPGEITVSLYPDDEFDKCEVHGGKINKEYKEFQENLKTLFWSKIKPNSDTLMTMMQRDEYYSDTMSIILSQYREASDSEEKDRLREIMTNLSGLNLDLSERAKTLSRNSDSIVNEMNIWKHDYIQEYPTIVSYYLLDEQLRYFEEEIDVIKAQTSYERLVQKFPEHPYNNTIKEFLDAQKYIKVGGEYIDFSAPDLHGDFVKLSDAIDGKIALIDLWASWCGPCIRHSRSMIPVYEEFKDSDFTIVGVASEFDNTDRMVQVIEREGFPWMNLVELDKQNRIWEKYGIPNAGGKSFLVDRDGTILAIHPSAEEIKEILQKKLY